MKISMKKTKLVTQLTPSIRACHLKVKISFSWKWKMGSEKMEPFYALNMGNILIFHLKHSNLHFLPLHYTMEISKEYKGKLWKSVFWNFELLNLLKSCLIALVRIPEVAKNLLTPILAYLDITYVRCQMRHLCQKCQKCNIWHICHPTHVIYRYGNMGVKRCVRTSGI